MGGGRGATKIEKTIDDFVTDHPDDITFDGNNKYTFTADKTIEIAENLNIIFEDEDELIIPLTTTVNLEGDLTFGELTEGTTSLQNNGTLNLVDNAQINFTSITNTTAITNTSNESFTMDINASINVTTINGSNARLFVNSGTMTLNGNINVVNMTDALLFENENEGTMTVNSNIAVAYAQTSVDFVENDTLSVVFNKGTCSQNGNISIASWRRNDTTGLGSKDINSIIIINAGRYILNGQIICGYLDGGIVIATNTNFETGNESQITCNIFNQAEILLITSQNTFEQTEIIVNTNIYTSITLDRSDNIEIVLLSVQAIDSEIIITINGNINITNFIIPNSPFELTLPYSLLVCWIVKSTVHDIRIIHNGDIDIKKWDGIMTSLDENYSSIIFVQTNSTAGDVEYLLNGKIDIEEIKNVGAMIAGEILENGTRISFMTGPQSEINVSSFKNLIYGLINMASATKIFLTNNTNAEANINIKGSTLSLGSGSKLI